MDRECDVRVAALYDVHGMAFALEAVLREVERERFDAVVFGGDPAAGPYPRETLALARSVEGALYVRGNAERDLHGWPREQIADADDEWLRSWPLTVELDGVLYCHATPRSRRTRFDVEAAARAIEASGWPDASGFVAENVRAAVTSAEAVAAFGG